MMCGPKFSTSPPFPALYHSYWVHSQSTGEIIPEHFLYLGRSLRTSLMGISLLQYLVVNFPLLASHTSVRITIQEPRSILTFIACCHSKLFLNEEGAGIPGFFPYTLTQKIVPQLLPIACLTSSAQPQFWNSHLCVL